MQNKRAQTSILRVGFEPTIPLFERVKAVNALDHCDRQLLNVACGNYMYHLPKHFSFLVMNSWYFPKQHWPDHLRIRTHDVF
jgi:hypothetical protein